MGSSTQQARSDEHTGDRPSSTARQIWSGWRRFIGAAALALLTITVTAAPSVAAPRIAQPKPKPSLDVMKQALKKEVDALAADQFRWNEIGAETATDFANLLVTAGGSDGLKIAVNEMKSVSTSIDANTAFNDGKYLRALVKTGEALVQAAGEEVSGAVDDLVQPYANYVEVTSMMQAQSQHLVNIAILEREIARAQGSDMQLNDGVYQLADYLKNGSTVERDALQQSMADQGVSQNDVSHAVLNMATQWSVPAASEMVHEIARLFTDSSGANSIDQITASLGTSDPFFVDGLKTTIANMEAQDAFAEDLARNANDPGLDVPLALNAASPPTTPPANANANDQGLNTPLADNPPQQQPAPANPPNGTVTQQRPAATPQPPAAPSKQARDCSAYAENVKLQQWAVSQDQAYLAAYPKGWVHDQLVKTLAFDQASVANAEAGLRQCLAGN